MAAQTVRSNGRVCDLVYDTRLLRWNFAAVTSAAAADERIRETPEGSEESSSGAALFHSFITMFTRNKQQLRHLQHECLKNKLKVTPVDGRRAANGPAHPA